MGKGARDPLNGAAVDFLGLVSRCEHQKLPPPQTTMVSTLRPVPSLICWQIRCLVVIPAGEGLHEGACAIRVEHRGDFMPSCGTPYGLPCPPRGDRPSREGGSAAGDRNTPNIRTLGSAAGDRNSYTGRPSSLKGILCIFYRFFLFSEIFVLYRF